MTALHIYRACTAAASPFIPFWLRLRQQRGKEEAVRLGERFGYASVARPAGKLVWIHAASVGEANAAQPLIEALRARFPQAALLLTTGTVTSAALMRQRLPAGVIHQYVPVDTPQATERFIAHWQPDAGLLVESELWPNLVHAAYAKGCKLALVNARMSERSFHRWNRFVSFISGMLSCMSTVYAQSEADAARFRALGAAKVECLGNLKFDGPPLISDAEELVALERQAGTRPRWLAASIHPGEDTLLAQTHVALEKSFPGLLTFIVPRHPARGVEMQANFEAAGLRVARRANGDALTAETQVYIADTMGELGLFYRLSRIALLGGSWVERGGQNPLEPARLGCAIVFGPHMFNFADIVQGLLAADAARQVGNPDMLATEMSALLNDPSRVAAMSARASAWVIGRAGVSERLLDRLSPLLEEAFRHAA